MRTSKSIPKTSLRTVDPQTGEDIIDFSIDWQDENMPVTRAGVNTVTGERVVAVYSAEMASAIHQHRMETDLKPSWRDDPSYFWSKNARRQNHRR